MNDSNISSDVNKDLPKSIETNTTIQENDQVIDDSVKPVETTEQSASVVAKPERSKNFLQEAAFSFPTTWNDEAEAVAMPSVLRKDATAAIELAPNISMVDSPKDREWAGTLNEGIQNASFDDNYLGTIVRKGSDFRQGIPGSAGLLIGGSPKFKSVENETLTGSRAVLRIQDYFGMGTVFQLPCWHTGIWITVKAPSESELLELQRQMTSDKIELGRQSYGLAFSNSSSYVLDRLVSFVLSHLYETTVDKPGDLKSLIKTQDIPALVWGLACAIYPRGFQYQRACATNPEKCREIVKERLSLSKLLWTNTRSLSAGQIAHMSKRRAGSMTIESVKAYQDQLLDCQKREIVINEGAEKSAKFILKVPTVAEYIDAGSRWIADIVTMVNQALGMDANDKDRNSYIFKQGQASSMRQYLHWVESVEFGGNNVEDTESLELIFDALSADDNIRNEFMLKIKDYIDDSCISLVGIPEYDCPKCNEVQKSPLPNNTSIIPIDIYQTFFTLLVQKLQKLTVR